MTTNNADYVRGRQLRLRHWMDEHDVDLAVFTSVEHVYYFSGARYKWVFSPALVIAKAGWSVLAAPTKGKLEHVADEEVSYEAQWHSTLRNDQRAESSRVLLDHLGDRAKAKRIAVEFSSVSMHLTGPLAGGGAELIDIEPTLFDMRRTKDPDELDRLRMAISGTEAMYRAAREMIRPGVGELEVFNRLQAVAVETYGEPLTGTGNDYQCGARGGDPRAGRVAAEGELYILDLGPAYQGYFADNARTIAVTDPTSRQVEAQQAIDEVFAHIEATVRPGVSCRGLFEQVQAMLDKAPVGVFNHHLGHGIGLFPHEAPHLNPHWDDTFRVGEVFTAEPGLYAPELQVGMRIENDYLVTDNGVECLTPWPTALKL